LNVFFVLIVVWWVDMRYNRDRFGWEIMVLARKLSLVLVQMLQSQDPNQQAVSSMMVLGGFLLLTLIFKPFVCYECIKQKKKRCHHWFFILKYFY